MSWVWKARSSLRTSLLDRLSQPVQTVGGRHPSLIEINRRSVVDVEPALLHARHERIQRERLPSKRRTVIAEALCGGPRDSDSQRAVAGVLLGACGSVDHHALAGPGGADKDRAALAAGDDLKSVGLFV